MAKRTSTTKARTTVTKKSNTTIKKGVITMTASDALNQLMIEYNKYQEYRKQQGQSYTFASKQDIASFAKHLTTEELTTLVKTYIYQRKIQQRLSKYLYNERILNNAYGKEDRNIMELSDEERQYIERRRKREAEKASQRKEVI